MNIAALDLKAYGPYSNQRLECEGPFTIVYGPNEAGKSSLLRAILALLFGIPERTRDNFRHDYSQLRVGATLGRSDGRTLEVMRRKGKLATLLDAAGKPMDESMLAEFCGHIDETTFTTLFCLDHQRLRQGGSNLLAGGGEVGQSLFEAGTGLLGLKNTLQQLEKEARELYRPQGSQPVLNRAMARYTDARRRARELLLRSDEWKKLKQGADDARAELDACAQELQAVQHQAERLGRIKTSLPLLARLERARADLAALQGVPLLAPDASQQRLLATADVEGGQARMAELTAQVEQAQTQLAALRVDEALLQRSADIEAALAAVGSYRDATQDLPQRIGKRDHFRTAVAVKREALPGAAVSPPEAARLRELIKQHGPLSSRLEEVEGQARELEGQMQGDTERLAALPPRLETRPLQAALEVGRALGNIEDRLREGRAALDTTRQHVETALAALPGWSAPSPGSAAEFERLPCPTRQSVEQFDTERSELAAEHRRLEQEVRARQEERDKLLAERGLLEASGEVATVERVQQARAYRERGWSLIRQIYVDKTLTVSDVDYGSTVPLGGGGGRTTLEGEYERAVLEADRRVDALRTDAQRVAQFTVLSDRLHRLGREEERLQADQAALRERLTGHQTRWQALWSSCGLVPGTPRECLGWLARRDEILRHNQEARRLATAVAGLETQVAEAARLLLQAGAGTSGGPLALQMAEASRGLEAAERQNRKRDELEQRLSERRRDLAAGRPKLAQLQDRWKQWQAAWDMALQPLQLGTHGSPAEIERLLSAWDEVTQATGKLHDEQRRIDGMEERVQGFKGRVAALVGALAPELASPGPAEAAEGLYRRLEAARRAQQSRQALTEQLEQKTLELERGRHQVAAAEARLQRLAALAECAVERLPAVEEEATRKRALLAEVSDLEGQLTELNGAGLARVLEEAEHEDRDGIPGRLAALQERRAALEQQRQTLTERHLDQQHRLQAMDGGDKAAQAAQEAQEALAELRDGTEDYIRLQAAGFLLRRAIESYRERNQGPLLKRAAELFPVLTQGSFVSIRTSFDDKDRLILVAVRADGSEVTVEGLSEGTVDQLYLSLRLAAIERHLAASEPVPLVLDDILIHFDDERAQATLRVLEAVSQHTQVLFFTHHQHLVQLARASVGDGLRILRLGEQEQPTVPAGGRRGEKAAAV